ncbi:MAG: phosphate signaling complex protein PhoU [Clostridia bacterium]|nr:phosphate signaling complex protein PhoU [Clostridia bacterium]
MAARPIYDSELNALHERLSKMCETIEKMIRDAVASLNTMDKEAGAAVSEADRTVDEFESAIEKMSIRLLLKQQPVAKDLTKITTALKVITDLERIGDQAADLGEMVAEYPAGELSVEPKRLKRMGEVAVSMVHEAVESFLNESEGGADIVAGADSELDNLLININADLIAMIKKDSATADEALTLLMAAKHLEKIGDYAVNVARWTKFVVTGVHPDKKHACKNTGN